jgi:hypothetical protein
LKVSNAAFVRRVTTRKLPSLSKPICRESGAASAVNACDEPGIGVSLPAAENRKPAMFLLFVFRTYSRSP